MKIRKNGKIILLFVRNALPVVVGTSVFEQIIIKRRLLFILNAIIEPGHATTAKHRVRMAVLVEGVDVVRRVFGGVPVENKFFVTHFANFADLGLASAHIAFLKMRIVNKRQ